MPAPRERLTRDRMVGALSAMPANVSACSIYPAGRMVVKPANWTDPAPVHKALTRRASRAAALLGREVAELAGVPAGRPGGQAPPALRGSRADTGYRTIAGPLPKITATSKRASARYTTVAESAFSALGGGAEGAWAILRNGIDTPVPARRVTSQVNPAAEFQRFYRIASTGKPHPVLVPSWYEYSDRGTTARRHGEVRGPAG
jgi:hypothetical protein